MVYNPLQYLPDSTELPCSDDTPVDNELQNLIPNLLLAILAVVRDRPLITTIWHHPDDKLHQQNDRG